MSKRHLSPSPKIPTDLRKKRDKTPPVHALAQALFSGYLDSFVVIRVLSLVSRDLFAQGARVVKALDLHATRRPHSLLAHCVVRRYQTSLVSLSLQWTPSTTDATVGLVVSSLPHLTHLNLRGCHQLTNHALTLITAALPSLTSLDLSFCSGLTDPSPLAKLSLLQELQLGMCPKFPKQTLIFLPTSLTALDIGGNSSIDPVAYLSRFRLLQSMDLSGCSSLDASAVIAFTQLTAPHLWHLSLAHCHAVSLSDLWCRWHLLPALRVLILRGILSGKQSKWTARVKACCPSLTFLDISCSDHSSNVKRELHELMPDLAVDDGNADFPIMPCACDDGDEPPRRERGPGERVVVVRQAP